jgi:hypothetical protein
MHRAADRTAPCALADRRGRYVPRVEYVVAAVVTLLAGWHALWIAALFRDATRGRGLAREVMPRRQTGRSPTKLLVALLLALLAVATGIAVLVSFAEPMHYRDLVLMFTIPLLVGFALLAQSFVLFATDTADRSDDTWVFAMVMAIPAAAILSIYASHVLYLMFSTSA